MRTVRVFSPKKHLEFDELITGTRAGIVTEVVSSPEFQGSASHRGSSSNKRPAQGQCRELLSEQEDKHERQGPLEMERFSGSNFTMAMAILNPPNRL